MSKNIFMNEVCAFCGTATVAVYTLSCLYPDIIGKCTVLTLTLFGLMLLSFSQITIVSSVRIKFFAIGAGVMSLYSAIIIYWQ